MGKKRILSSFCPLPYFFHSIPPHIPNSPSIPHGNVRRATVSILLGTSRDIYFLSMQPGYADGRTHTHVEVHTHTHTHTWYLRSEIINANRGAADPEAGERQTQDQGLLKQTKPRERKYTKTRWVTQVPWSKHLQFFCLCTVHFISVLRECKAYSFQVSLLKWWLKWTVCNWDKQKCKT